MKDMERIVTRVEELTGELSELARENEITVSISVTGNDGYQSITINYRDGDDFQGDSLDISKTQHGYQRFDIRRSQGTMWGLPREQACELTGLQTLTTGEATERYRETGEPLMVADGFVQGFGEKEE